MRHALCQDLKHGSEPSDCESSCAYCHSHIEGLGLHVVYIVRYVIRIKKHLHNRIESHRKDYESLHPYSQISTKSINFQRNLPRKFPWNLPFFTNCFSAKLAPKIPTNMSLKIPRNLLFFATYQINQKPCSMAQPIRFDCLKKIPDRGWYKFGGKLALFMQFGTFLMMKAKQDRMKCLF